MAMFAVGKPRVPPRASPATTMPSSSTGRANRRAAPRTSPPARAGGSRWRTHRPRDRPSGWRSRAARARRGSRRARGRSGNPGRPRRAACRSAAGSAPRTPPAPERRPRGRRRPRARPRPRARRSAPAGAPAWRAAHAVAEGDARVRVEGDNRRREVAREYGLDDAPVAEVDAVEGADCDGPWPPVRLIGGARRAPRRPPKPAGRAPRRDG